MDSPKLANEVARLLSENCLRLVLAESCTGGRCASLLTEVPGISKFFCGSAVTYRENTKEQWLGIDRNLLAEFSAESMQVSEKMASQVLSRTPEADLSCAVTGHLGPVTDSGQDGIIFIVVMKRNLPISGEEELQPVHKLSFKLESIERVDRQQEAAEQMLKQLKAHLLTLAE